MTCFKYFCETKKLKGSGVVSNTAPVLTAPATVNSDQQVVISVSADDVDVDALSYMASTGRVASTALGVEVTFIAPAVTDDTVVDVVVTVSDGQATDTATVAVTVKADTGTGDTTWDPNKVYNTGDSVTYNGVKYTAKWWTKGEQLCISTGLF